MELTAMVKHANLTHRKSWCGMKWRTSAKNLIANSELNTVTPSSSWCLAGNCTGRRKKPKVLQRPLFCRTTGVWQECGRSDITHAPSWSCQDTWQASFWDTHKHSWETTGAQVPASFWHGQCCATLGTFKPCILCVACFFGGWGAEAVVLCSVIQAHGKTCDDARFCMFQGLSWSWYNCWGLCILLDLVKLSSLVKTVTVAASSSNYFAWHFAREHGSRFLFLCFCYTTIGAALSLIFRVWEARDLPALLEMASLQLRMQNLPVKKMRCHNNAGGRTNQAGWASIRIHQEPLFQRH